MSMKAWVLRKRSDGIDVGLETVPKPSVQEQEVLVKVNAASLNRRDYWMTVPGMYPEAWVTDGSVIGSDCCGVVVESGHPQTKHWIGKEVIIDPMTDWVKGVESLLGLLPRPGAFAEYISVPVTLLHEKPPHLSPEQASALPIAAVTAYRALVTKGCLKAGENVLIPGIGSGVALFALQFATALGANVYVTSSSQQKIDKAKDLGAKEGFNYKEDSWLKELSAKCPEGIDLVIDGSAGTPWNNLITKVIKSEGRIVNFGATGSQKQEIVVPHLFIKQIDIKGTSMGSPADFTAMVELVTSKRIVPIIDTVRSMAEMKTSLQHMADMKHFGKLVLTLDKEAQL